LQQRLLLFGAEYGCQELPNRRCFLHQEDSVCNELQRRGYHSIHGDNDLPYWNDPKTGEPLDSPSYEHWIWDVEKVRAVVADRNHPASFLCGGSRNLDRFIDLLDGVFVLEVDLDTLNRRLAVRPEDEWGGPASDGESNARLQHSKKEDIPENAITIDATAPIAPVVDAILAKCQLATTNDAQQAVAAADRCR